MEEVTCELKYSGVADAFLALAVAGTLAIVLLVPFPGAARAALVAWVAGGAAAARARLRRAHALRIRCDGTIEVHGRHGVRSGRLARGSFVSPCLTIVNWRPERARFSRTLVLLPGMVGADALRNIRMIVRWA